MNPLISFRIFTALYSCMSALLFSSVRADEGY